MLSSFFKILSESAENSNCHGISHISKNGNWLIKILWIVCFCASCSYCIYNLSLSLVDFFNYDVHTKVEIHRKTSIEFPALTICHKNLINSTKLRKYSPDLFYKFLESKIFFQSFNLTDSMFENLSIMEANFILNFLENNNEINNFTYEIDDFLLDCIFNFVKCTKNDFERLLIPKLGNCYKFNSKNLFKKPVESIYAGTNGGLKLVLKIVPEDELNIMKSNGFQLYIHNSSSIPFNDFDLINVAGGFETNIAIVQEHITKLSEPYSDCVQDSKPFKTNMYISTLSKFGKYQQKYCIYLCYYEHMKDLCGCYFVEVYGIKYSETCNISKTIECLEKYDQLFEPIECLKLCPNECESIRYYNQISQSNFPSRLSFDILINKYPNIFFDYEKNKSSLLTINVYHDDISLRTIKDTPAKTIIQLVAEIGGFMGLCIGASLLTIVELADFLLKIIFIRKETKIENIFPK